MESGSICVAPIAYPSRAGDPRRRGGPARPAGLRPEHISPVVAALTTAGCPFTEQVFSVVGGSMGIYAGWSIAREVTSDTGWSVDTLTEAMGSLPHDIEVNSQRNKAFGHGQVLGE